VDDKEFWKFWGEGHSRNDKRVSAIARVGFALPGRVPTDDIQGLKL